VKPEAKPLPSSQRRIDYTHLNIEDLDGLDEKEDYIPLDPEKNYPPRFYRKSMFITRGDLFSARKDAISQTSEPLNGESESSRQVRTRMRFRTLLNLKERSFVRKPHLRKGRADAIRVDLSERETHLNRTDTRHIEIEKRWDLQEQFHPILFEDINSMVSNRYCRLKISNKWIGGAPERKFWFNFPFVDNTGEMSDTLFVLNMYPSSFFATLFQTVFSRTTMWFKRFHLRNARKDKRFSYTDVIFKACLRYVITNDIKSFRRVKGALASNAKRIPMFLFDSKSSETMRFLLDHTETCSSWFKCRRKARFSQPSYRLKSSLFKMSRADKKRCYLKFIYWTENFRLKEDIKEIRLNPNMGGRYLFCRTRSS